MKHGQIEKSLKEAAFMVTESRAGSAKHYELNAASEMQGSI
jgi:hypothetical protein